jgi:hypothetical protein
MRMKPSPKPGAEAGAAALDGLGPSADLEHAWGPRIGRDQVVDDDRRPRIGLHVAVLLGGRDVHAAASIVPSSAL